MLDSYVIDAIRKEERRGREEARIPLYIYPPEFDGYRDSPPNPADTNKRGYIEVDYGVELDVNRDSLVINM